MLSRFVRLAKAPAGATLLVITALLLALTEVPAWSQTTSTTNALAEALDAPSFSFASSDTNAWFSQKKTTADGVDAAQSGITAANGKSTLTVSVTGVTKFSFKWKVSSEANRDVLTFYIDDVAQTNPISGNTDWQTRTYTLSGTGSHTLKWEYAKDSSASYYSDAGWVDQFTILAASVPIITVQPADVSVGSGDNASFSVQSIGGAALSYQWYRGDSGVTTSPVDGATGPLLLSPPLSANARYWVKITQGSQSENSRSAVATVTRRSPFSLVAAGVSSEGALGLGNTTSSTSSTKVAIAAVRAAAGAHHSLFIKSDGSLWASGANAAGQLGDGTTTDRTLPTRILASGVLQVAVGEAHSLFLKSDGSVWGMGSNTDGQLARSDTASNVSSPVQIFTNVVQIAAGARHSLFLKKDGTVWAVGSFGGASPASSAVQLASQVSLVSAGKAHSLFIKSNGTLWAWGGNVSGQLGDGTNTDRTAPVFIGDRVVFASAGDDHSLFIRSDGFLHAMGSHAQGQLGAGSSVTGSTSLPRQIVGKVVRAVAGARHSLFIKSDGTLWAMGDNSSGQFGNGTVGASIVPIQVATDFADAAAGDTHSLFLKTPPSHTVTFSLGAGAKRTGGGALVQVVREGEDAVAPIVAAPAGKVLHDWSAGLSFVTSPLTVEAIYFSSQSITFAQPPARVFTPPSGTLTLSTKSSSGLPVALTVVSGPATLNGNALTYTGGGQIIVRATCASGAIEGVQYAAATSVQRTIEITKLAQSVAFAPPASATYGDEPITLSATTNVDGLAVTFELVSGPASLDGDTLSFTGAGDVVVSAKQTGDDAYAAAYLSRTIKVGKKTLLVSAEDETRAVGEPNPIFTPNYTGLVGDDSADDTGIISVPPVLVSSASSSAAPGVYPVALLEGLSTSYSFKLASPAPTLTVIGYGGSYEALLDGPAHDAVPAGKLELTVASRSLLYTGTLRLAAEAAPIAIRGELIPAPDFSGAAHTFIRAASGNLSSLELAFTVSANGELYGTLESGDAAPLAFADGVRLGLPAAPLGEGAHTLVLGTGLDTDETSIVPGFGYATAALAAKTAVLTLNGKLADGSPLTAALKPAADRSYRLWATPYKQRFDSFLGGRLALTAHPEPRFTGRYYIPAEAGVLLFWAKAALPEATTAAKRDDTYRAGFGPLSCSARLDPWLPPLAAKGTQPAVTLAQRLGLAADNTSAATLAVVQGEENTEFGQLASALPTTLALDAKGRVTLTAPITIPGNPAAWKLLKLDPATGAFNGRFVLRDPPASGTREVVRTVEFSGMLRQAPAAEGNASVAEGFLVLPALDSAGESASHAFRLVPAAN